MSPRPALRWPVLVAWLLLAAAFSFAPFRPGYHGPRRVASGASPLPGGGLRLTGPAQLRTSDAPVWLAAGIDAGDLTLRVDVQTADAAQGGPARILTVSEGWLSRNFMVAQKGVDLLVRARRPGADTNGAPPMKIDGVFADGERRAIEVRFRRGAFEVDVDGEPRYREPYDEDPFAGWNRSFRAALGDEVDGAREWRGDVFQATASVGDQAWDLLAPGALERPAEFWHVPEATRRLFQFERSHALLVGLVHAALFLPLGLLLGLLSGGRRMLAALAAGGLIGALLQVGKLVFEGRHPCIYHAIPDALGACSGAWLAAWIHRSRT